jgi:serpin B
MSDDEVYKANGALVAHLKSVQGDDLQLNVANKLYPQSGYSIKQEFVDILQGHYGSEVQSLDYANANEAVNTINGWVEEKTKQKVKDLLSQNDINASVRLILVNAVYFKGNWANKFEATMTGREKFHLADGTTEDVDMMKLFNKKFIFKEKPFGIPASVCELPYVDERMSMTIVLPDAGVPLAEVESKLDSNFLKAFFDLGRYKSSVHVSIPKFKFEESIEVNLFS